jgi:hypothetical protein
MLLFIVVLIVAAIVGGFAGGELVGTSFSILGAAIGGVGTAAVLLGLGAYFHSQERKRSRDLTPEMRGVFDRLVTGKANPTPEEINRAKQAWRNRR